MKTYEKGSRKKVSSTFEAAHFACRGRGCCSRLLIDEKLVDCLQQIRNHFGKPLYINSAYRCATHNKKVGGAIGSYHTKGQAADIVVHGVAPAEVAKFAESIGVLGIGLYETAKDGYFVHIDTRGAKSFWYGQAEIPRTTFGGDAFFQFVRQLQLVLGLEANGAADFRLLSAAPTVSAVNHQRHGVIRPLQTYLAALGYTEVGSADGIAGPKFTAALNHFQQDHGCDTTGIAEQWGKTWHKLLQLEEGLLS